jgi:hypothetical protein
MTNQFDEATEKAFGEIFENDCYKTTDSINKSISKIDNIIDDARNNDQEYYNELKEIFERGMTCRI